MQRAGHQRSPSIRATALMSPVRNPAAVSGRLADERNDERSAGGAVRIDDSSHRGPRQKALETIIKKRIVGRLPGRVRNLNVRAYTALVILEGECATFYTKQLAQHAAMGVLEDEQLENAIVVSVEQ